MNYLYGDSTASPLTSNFLEFLRDATDFCVFGLQADDGIDRGKERIAALRADAETEMQRLHRFTSSVSKAIDDGEKGANDSPASQCAARLTTMVASAYRKSLEEVQQRLAEVIAQIDAEEAASRAAVRNALGTLLAPHDPHEATRVVHLERREGGPYAATLTGGTSFGLKWTFELEVPGDNAWHAPIRVDALFERFEIRAPQLTGFFSKEVKVRPQRLDKHIVTDFVDDGASVTFKLRPEPGVEVGFDVEVDALKEVKMTRIGPAEDASIGPFDVQAEDVAPIVALSDKLRASAASGLKRGNLAEATLDDGDVTVLPKFGELVARLVAFMAPVVREIADRSLTSNELVIRRLLGNDRREEIFVPKAILREKYGVLSQPLAAAFRPLGLELPEAPKSRPSEPVADEAPPIRAQLAPSTPPPGPLPGPPAPPFRVNTARPPVTANAAVPPPASPPNEVTAEGLTAAEIVALSSDALIEVTVNESGSLPPDSEPMPAARNEALAGALKRVALLVRNGRGEEAYGQYAELYRSKPFADYRPDDQRQALRLMLVPKTPPTSKTEAVLDAHRAAAARLQALTATVKEPADYELLGIAQLVLDNGAAASDAFREGLSLERARNPGSDLCGNLMRRLSAI